MTQEIDLSHYKKLICVNNENYFKDYRKSTCYYCNYCMKEICLSNRIPHLNSERHLKNKRLSTETFNPEIFIKRRINSL